MSSIKLKGDEPWLQQGSSGAKRIRDGLYKQGLTLSDVRKPAAGHGRGRHNHAPLVSGRTVFIGFIVLLGVAKLFITVAFFGI